MDYMEVRFFNDASLNEAIIAWLGENEYDMFEEREDGVNAYISAGLFDEEKLKNVLLSIPGSGKMIRYRHSLIKDQNWNKKWEENFEPINVSGRVYIRAPFHPPREDYQYEIIIEPKMSFGTGHHATTALMVTLMLEYDLSKKRVLDMGCGTGVLAILAVKMGAGEVTAIDIDEWAFANTKENCLTNQTTEIRVSQGDARAIKGSTFDVILANINRNVLLNDIPAFGKSLNTGGALLLSGFLAGDKELIANACAKVGLTFTKEAAREDWIALQFKK
jgi:ribosomal protein L11 methyltransferase